ncbi:uncharacterized protein LOC131207588 [Anopheles bellator]|uniref:uncharacterized protein LOC131207588 n=1 Tax=Anopheles bellator TaxID=139047 RepID=UPI0026474A49|nr:uncharacterized protein LOC131207588 [Anopheles bellator]
MASKVAILCFAVAVVCWPELRATSGAVLFNGAYSDTSLVDDIEQELLRFDGGRHSLADQGEEPDFRTDFDLSQLHPISATPSFTLDPSYIGPDDVFLATRTKRANWVALDASKRAKLRKRKQDKERLDDDEERERLVEEEEEEEEEEGKVVSSADEREPAEPLEDYATRYEQFIAKHFDDDGDDVGSSKRREKSAQTRKAPAKKPAPGAQHEDDDDDREEQDGDYKFDRFDYSSSADYERIKAESEEQSKRLAADPRNCRTYEKDGMVCSVCHDPASESASENCAYANEPHHRKYAFVKERNYDSKKDAPQEAHDADDDEGDDDGEGAGRADSRPEREAVPPLGSSSSTTTTSTPDRKQHPLRRPILRSNPHQLATVVTTNGGGYRYQPPAIDLRSNRAMKLQAERADGADEPTDIYVMDYGDQDEVAKVLKDFASRDWSNCRKGNRTENGELTCYQCRDAAGVNHEECMYVSESRQTATGIVSPPDPPKDKKLRKRKKVVPLRKAALMSPRIEIEPPHTGKQNEKQTVKRTVSFRSYVAGSGLGRPGSSKVGPHGVSPGGPGERVIRYEHHISHEVP